MLELVLLILIVLISVLNKSIRILNLIFLLLPFHGLIKDLLSYYYGEGDLFSYWKEIVVIIYLLKVRSKHKLNNRLIIAIVPFFLITLIYFIIGLDVSAKYSIIHLRDYIFPFLLLISVGSNDFSKSDVKSVLISFSVGAIIVATFGFFEYFFLPMRVFLSLIKNLRFSIYLGHLYFDNTWMILGYQRMVSVFDNPNQLGAYLALYISVLSLMGDKFLIKFNGIKRVVILSYTGLALVLTFSRTSYVILILVFILTKFNSRDILNKSSMLKTGLALSLIIAFILSNKTTYDVICSTLNGSESSSADRGNNMSKGTDFVLEHPFGLGLGASDARNLNSIYTAESANINLCIEEGILGIVFIFFTFYRLNKILYATVSHNNLARSLLKSTFLTAFFSVTPYLYFYLYIMFIIVGISCSRDMYTFSHRCKRNKII